MRYLLSFIFSAIIFSAYSQNDQPQLYKVGYRNILATDSSRIYKPGTQSNDRLHYRPLEMDIWYPADSSSQEPRQPPQAPQPLQSPQSPQTAMEYGEFLQLLQQRSNRFQNDTVYQDMTKELVQYLCAGLKIADTTALAHLKTTSYRNATPAARPFPLIIYMCSYNGMSYENIHLLEGLAAHGYIVASVTSVGRYPGNMSTDCTDLFEQVRDGLFTMGRVRNSCNVDPGKVGVAGYSWGGLAALLLSMNTDGVAATLSLDGSEMHYYGESAEEDDNFIALRNSPFFSIDRLHTPYTYLESGDKQTDQQADSIFNILPFLSGSRQYFRFPGTNHEDFSSLPSLARRTTARNSSAWITGLDSFPLCYFDKYLKGRTAPLSNWLAVSRQKNHTDSAYPVVRPMTGKGLVIRGKVLDQKDKTPLAFVNVGIPEKNLGTVTQHDGSFILVIGPELSGDSIRLSMVGYKGQTIKIDRLIKQKQPLTFLLGERIAELKEVVVTSKAPRSRRLGNTTTSLFVSVGFPMRFLGAELGVRIKLGQRPVRLRSFNFNISTARIDSAVFRLNIYRFGKGLPAGNILKKNIFVPVGKTVGAYTIDLTRYELVEKGDILVSLELIEGSFSNPSSGQNSNLSAHPSPGAIYLSAGFLNSATWRRPTSQAKWKRAAGIGVGFNVVVQE
jgi:hypothetical protein